MPATNPIPAHGHRSQSAKCIKVCSLALLVLQIRLQLEMYFSQAGEGPPYGLLQGSLDGLSDVPPHEETVTAK